MEQFYKLTWHNHASSLKTGGDSLDLIFNLETNIESDAFERPLLNTQTNETLGDTLRGRRAARINVMSQQQFFALLSAIRVQPPATTSGTLGPARVSPSSASAFTTPHNL